MAGSTIRGGKEGGIVWVRNCCSMTEGVGMLNAGVGIAPGWWFLEKRQFQLPVSKIMNMYFGLM